MDKDKYRYWCSRSGNELAKLSEFLESSGAPKEDIAEVEKMIETLITWQKQSLLTTPFSSDLN